MHKLSLLLLLLWASAAEAGCPKLFSGLVPNWMLNHRTSGSYDSLLSNRAAHQYGIEDAIGEVMGRELTAMGFYAPHRVYDYSITPEMYLGRKSWDHRFALTHSGMPAALKEMKEAGYGLTVNNSLAMEHVLGRTSPGRGAIQILPHTSWAVFQHELQHMRGNKFGFGFGYYQIPPGITPTKREEKMLAAVKKLREKGFGSKAIDETLAVRAEIRELEKIGYMPWSGPVYEARKYAWKFQKESLTEETRYGQGTKAQRARLRFIQVKEQLLRPLVVRAALGLAAGEALYYNDEIEAFIVKIKDGTWRVLGLEKALNGPAKP
ncbi:MAG: hypothetical protein EOP11_07105 [Proteobacteria bacterium]|nr:MAG: hypothetical protein EOP11_07105 [Pseudomonadota bacterium]